MSNSFQKREIYLFKKRNLFYTSFDNIGVLFHETFSTLQTSDITRIFKTKEGWAYLLAGAAVGYVGTAALLTAIGVTFRS